MPDNPDTCPVCAQPAVARCKCLRCDRVCANGHHWHSCFAHPERVVLGEAPHGPAAPDCTCPAGEGASPGEPTGPAPTEEGKDRLRREALEWMEGMLRQREKAANANPPTLAELVRALELRAQVATDTAREIVATLRLNERHFFKGDDPHGEIFWELVRRWEKRLKDLGG